MTTAEPTWALHPLVRLNWRQLGEDWVVFDSGSGNTHQLPALAAGLLMCIEQQPQGETALRESLGEVFGSDDAARLESMLAEVLHQLCALELIEPGRR